MKYKNLKTEQVISLTEKDEELMKLLMTNPLYVRADDVVDSKMKKVKEMI